VKESLADQVNQFRKPVDTPASNPDSHRLVPADAGDGDGLVELRCQFYTEVLDLLTGIFHVNLKKWWKVEMFLDEIRISHGNRLFLDKGLIRGRPLSIKFS
jgi:hypothetical protein